jgi:hypothetical protein
MARQAERKEPKNKLRVQDSNRGYLDGMVTGRDFLADRTITITKTIIVATSPSIVGALALER